MRKILTLLMITISSVSYAKQEIDEKYYLFEDDPKSAVSRVAKYNNFKYEAASFETFEYAVKDLEGSLDTAIETDDYESICNYVGYTADLMLGNIKYQDQYDKKLNKVGAYRKSLKNAVNEKLVHHEACKYDTSHDED